MILYHVGICHDTDLKMRGEETARGRGESGKRVEGGVRKRRERSEESEIRVRGGGCESNTGLWG